MKTLFDANFATAQPQTHAIVIGVNEYPHLPGGALFDERPAARDFGLRALSSPVVSATAVVEWLLSRHNNPSAPLGSVELLLSPARYTPSDAAAATLGVSPAAPLVVPEADFASIRAAFGRWYARANKHRDNVALFYYCGHGLEATDRYLLPTDFGAEALDWTSNLINFTLTYNNLDRCKANTQCFFLDACRDQPEELQRAAAKGQVGQPLLGPQAGGLLGRDAPIYHAAAPQRSAAGPPNEQSYFTRALLECFNGLGAGQPAGAVAAVDGDSLGKALRELVDRLAEEHKLPLRCHVTGEWLLPRPVELHLASAPINVLSIVSCKPVEAQKAALLSLRDRNGQRQARGPANEKPWKLVVPAGAYTVEAAFTEDAPFQGLRLEQMALPPVFQPILSIADRQPALVADTSGEAQP